MYLKKIYNRLIKNGNVKKMIKFFVIFSVRIGKEKKEKRYIIAHKDF